MDVIGGCDDCVFGQASRQLARFQEEVEEIMNALLGAQAKRRRMREQELRKNMVEVSSKIKTSIVEGNQRGYLQNIKSRIEQLQIAIDVVMKECSTEARMSATPVSRKIIEEHAELYRQCYSWLRNAKRSIIES